MADDAIAGDSRQSQEEAIANNYAGGPAVNPNKSDETSEQLRAQIQVEKDRAERLNAVLREARDQIVSLKAEVDKLHQPPSGFGVFLEANEDDTVTILSNGRKMRVTIGEKIDPTLLKRGQEVMLNENLNVIESFGFEDRGEVVMLKEILEDERRALVLTRTDEEEVVFLADSILGTKIRAGDALLHDPRSGFVYEKIPKSEVEELVLEEVPDINYSDIGGLANQIDQIRDAVELPYLHGDLYEEYSLRAPKGILLYGPPGCGKTLIAKAVANSLAKRAAEKKAAQEGELVDGNAGTQTREARSYFLNIKGPELLNKYVGETERHIRLVFQRAREKAGQGNPVIVFFDEMDSLFKTRGTGVSSDVENTIVPQLLSEIDGVESLENVIVIGASNREDMIDPAILRPGRLDVKIKIERPDAQAAADIMSKYLTSDLPLHPDDLAEHDNNADATAESMVQNTIEHMYEERPENEFLEVTYANGDKEVLYFKDFNSGAMIENIVGRAKKSAIKEFLETGVKGIRVGHLLDACIDEFHENEDLPNTTNPDDWARISGKRGERIVYIRTLVQHKKGEATSRSFDTVANTGQYL